MKTSSLSQDDLEHVRDFIRRVAAIELSSGKDYLINQRLGEVARELGLEGAEQVVKKLRTLPTEKLRDRIVSALTTNETLFFRDRQSFEVLRERVLPQLLERNKTTRRLRIWSAACSSGQEPYTMAMLLTDVMEGYPHYRIDILATDVDRIILEKAREGKYKKHEIDRGLPPKYASSFFRRVGDEWQVDRRLMNMVQFKQCNLADPWPGEAPFDLVLMRNVLIYFGTAAKQSILERTTDRLAEHGLIMLGAGETLLGLDLELARVGVGPTSFYTRTKAREDWKRAAS